MHQQGYFMRFSMALFLALAASAQAATIAIIDTEIDYSHERLSAKMWSAPNENRNSVYRGVINGWNFLNKSPQIFSNTRLRSLPQSPATISEYYELYKLNEDGVATSDQQISLKKLNKDLNFMKEIKNHKLISHGTHVAGIASENANHEIMGLILTPIENYVSPNDKLNIKRSNAKNADETMMSYMQIIAENNTSSLFEMNKFLKVYPVDIANGSYGNNIYDSIAITDKVFQKVFNRKPLKEESLKWSLALLNQLIKFDKLALAEVKNTLFVFGAGNNGADNDIYIISPANADAENSISVAATDGLSSLAFFSNYGIKTVDIAAPGVQIYSTAPGNVIMPKSGTSMAAPFVSRIAGLVKDLNPRLTPFAIKQILMGTVDKKDFLKNKVKSEGIVNEKRALRAAELSQTLDLSLAIALANNEIPQIKK